MRLTPIEEQAARLDRLEQKVDAALGLLYMLAEDAGIELAPAFVCPNCGGDKIEDTSTGEGPRFTCLTIGCGQSFVPLQEAANG